MSKGKLITPKELLRDLKDVQKMTKTIMGKRLLLLYLDLYIDYFINRLYAEKIKELEIKGINISCVKGEDKMKVKATHLVIWGIIKNRDLKPIFLIHHLRCNLAHNLKPDLSKLEIKINKLPPDLKDPTGLMSAFLKKADPWDKIQLYAFPIIYHLYCYLKRVLGEDLDYKLEFYIAPNGLRVVPKLIKLN